MLGTAWPAENVVTIRMKPGTLYCSVAACSGQFLTSMSNDQKISSPLAVHRDCPRCGKPVQPVDLITECPHCGYEIRNPRPVPLSETMISGDVPAAAVQPPRASAPARQADPLVGTELGVYRI